MLRPKSFRNFIDRLGFDRVILLSFILLNTTGLLTLWGIGDAVRPFFFRQLWFVLIGLVVMALAAHFDYRIFKNYSRATLLVYLAALVLLAVTLFSGSVRGISAWISIGSLRLEPSEFAKLAVVILLAKYFSIKHVEIYRVHHLIASGFYVGLPALLILMQPDLGSAIVLGAIWLAMLLAAGIKRKHLLVMLILGLVMAVAAWFYLLAPYQKGRISSFVNPYLDPKGEGYSIIQAKVALGSGGWWGNGLGQGTQARFGFLPEAHTDFAVAALGEQFGWAGLVATLGILFVMLRRIGQIGFRMGNNFAKLFAIGLMTFIFCHILINAGMNLGVMPITGIPFPFISYGGSFMLALTLGLGLIQSIGRTARG